MNIEYRKVIDKDFPSLVKIIKDNFDVEIDSIANSNSQYSFVAICEDIVVGHLLFTRIFNPIKNIYYGKIDYVCVDSNYRNHHIATNLLQKIENIESDVSYFELTSNKNREIANILYLKQGYSVIDTNLFRKFINI